MAKKQAKTSETKTFIMGLIGGKMRKITVPDTWKVTFGPLVPGMTSARMTGHGGELGMALRFYEGKDMQRAVFTDVIWFRDESLQVEERVTKTKQKIIEKDTPKGRRATVMEARVTEWSNPDAPDNDDEEDDGFLQITDETGKDF